MSSRLTRRSRYQIKMHKIDTVHAPKKVCVWGNLNPRPWRSSDALPRRGLSKVAGNARHACHRFFQYFMGHLLRNLTEKLTGTCQVTELWRHKGNKVRPFLREMAGYYTFGSHIDHDEAPFDYFRSELTCLTPPQCPLDISVKARSRSDQWPRLT